MQDVDSCVNPSHACFSSSAAFLLTPSPAADVWEPLFIRDNLHQELSTGDYSSHRYDQRPRSAWASIRFWQYDNLKH